METASEADELQIVMIDPKLLIPHPDRARAKTVLAKDDSKYHSLKNSIEEFGIKSPLLVQESSNVIIGGHTRREIALELKKDRVPVHYVDVDDNRALYLLIQDILDEGAEETDIMKTSWQIYQYVFLYGIRHGGDRKSEDAKEGTLGYKEVAKIFGMSVTSLKQHLRLQKLIDELQELASKKVISLKGGYILAGLSAKEQYAAYQSILLNMKVTPGYAVSEKEAKGLKNAHRGKPAKEMDNDEKNNNWLDTDDIVEIPNTDDDEAEEFDGEPNHHVPNNSDVSGKGGISELEFKQIANMQILEAAKHVDMENYKTDKAEKEIESAIKTHELAKQKTAKLLNMQGEESRELYAISNVKESIHAYKLAILRSKAEFITDMSLVKEKSYEEVAEWLNDLNDTLQQTAEDVNQICEIVNKALGR